MQHACCRCGSWPRLEVQQLQSLCFSEEGVVSAISVEGGGNYKKRGCPTAAQHQGYRVLLQPIQ